MIALPPFVVIEVAQQISPPTLTKVVRRHANHSDNKHDRAGSHTQPRLVHVSLRGYASALHRSLDKRGSSGRQRSSPARRRHTCRQGRYRDSRHTMQVSCHPGTIRVKPVPTCIATMLVWARPSLGRMVLGNRRQAGQRRLRVEFEVAGRGDCEPAWAGRRFGAGLPCASQRYRAEALTPATSGSCSIRVPQAIAWLLASLPLRNPR